MRTYTGIGSRSTPEHVLAEMRTYAQTLADLDYTLRSGAADGADKAFQTGAFLAQGSKEIYIPWNGFSDYKFGMQDIIVGVTPAAMEMAAQYHPAWHKCGTGARKLHARNCYQILGHQLNDPSEFVICWTPNGMLQGGTAQALRLAMDHCIPVYNLALIRDRALLAELINEKAAKTH